jgi:hypothetical protein
MCEFTTYQEPTIWQIIKDISSILLPLSSLVVAISAFVVSRKISLKKTIKDRQLDLVYELIESLSKATVNFSWKEKDNLGGISGMSLYHFIYSNFKEKNKYLFDRKQIYYQANSFDDYTFRQLMGNPLLPGEIYAVLDRFSPRHTTMFTFEQIEATNDFVAHITLNKKTNELDYFSSNSSDLKTFNDFYNLVVELFDTTNTWLKKYGAHDLMFKKNLLLY